MRDFLYLISVAMCSLGLFGEVCKIEGIGSMSLYEASRWSVLVGAVMFATSILARFWRRSVSLGFYVFGMGVVVSITTEFCYQGLTTLDALQLSYSHIVLRWGAFSLAAGILAFVLLASHECFARRHTGHAHDMSK